jgi:hypothetical protein
MVPGYTAVVDEVKERVSLRPELKEGKVRECVPGTPSGPPLGSSQREAWKMCWAVSL